MSNFTFYKQLDSMDCGPTCLRMVVRYYGKNYSLQYLRNQSYITREGEMPRIRETDSMTTIFVNGYKFPTQFDYKNIEFYIDDIKQLTWESKRQEACTNCR